MLEKYSWMAAEENAVRPTPTKEQKPFVKMQEGEAELILKLRAEGYCYADIAAKVGRSTTTVHRVMQKAGILQTPKYYTQEQKDKIIAQYRLGKSYKEVACDTGLHYNTVYRVVNET